MVLNVSVKDALNKKNIIDIRKAFGIILPNVLLGQAIGR